MLQITGCVDSRGNSTGETPLSGHQTTVASSVSERSSVILLFEWNGPEKVSSCVIVHVQLNEMNAITITISDASCGKFLETNLFIYK